MAYQCPLCQLPLELNDRTYRCENNHQFDLAKEGYINLMPAHHKRSKDPGDNKAMMQARRQFLSEGYYRPMRDKVAAICAQQIKGDHAQLLDIGCGEGYYTESVSKQLALTHTSSQVYGLDISKVAIRYAAKRYQECLFSVASSHRLPFPANHFDAVLRIYAPCKAEELLRCVKEDGHMITVTPGPRHLYQLRENIYQDVRLHSDKAEQISGFELIQEESIHYTMDLTNGSAFHLLQMTPFAWKASDEFRQTLQSATLFNCEADFIVRVYRRTTHLD